jgi:hypothetical protein
MTKYPMTKEVRMTNDETRNRSAASVQETVFVFRASSFLRHWVFRHSSLARAILAASLAIAAFLPAHLAFAQAVPSKEPSSTHIFPAGGRRGTTVPVRIGTEAMPPGANFRLWGDGVRGPEQIGARVKARYEPSLRRPPRDADGAGAATSYPTEWQSTLTIADDAPIGMAAWRLTCGWGGTQPRPFLIGELPEFIETESNSTADRAERVTLPVTINGQIAGERDIDCFVFAARAGDAVTCVALAARIGSPLDPVIELRHADGRRVATETNRVAGDSILTFRVPSDGDYLLQVSNVSFRGGPEFVYRMTLQTEDPGGVAGTNRRAGGVSPPIDREQTIHQGADAPPSPTEMPIPSTIRSALLTASAEHTYHVGATKDELLAIVCEPASVASAAMPIIVLEDAPGGVLAKASSAEAADRECRIEWRAPADGEYRLRVRDLQHGVRGGPQFAYRLAVSRAEPDFSLRLARDYANLLQGGREELELSIRRTGGFAGTIDLALDGLPEGVTFEPARVTENQTNLKLVLKAIDDTRPTDATIRVVGKATIAGRSVEHAAGVPHLGEATGAEQPAAIANAVSLTVQHKPIVKLTCNEAYQYGHRGSIHRYAMQIERLGGFDGEVHLQLCERQVQDLDGIEVFEQIIPPGVTEFENFVYLPESMHTSVQHHCRPYSQAWALFTDKWGQRQSMLTISDKRNMIRTMPTVAKLRAVDDHVTARPGQSVRCRFALDRTANFTGAMDVELIEPGSGDGFTAERVRIEAGESSAEAIVRVNDNPRRSPGGPLKFRAVGKLRDDVVVISETTVLLTIEQ